MRKRRSSRIVGNLHGKPPPKDDDIVVVPCRECGAKVEVKYKAVRKAWFGIRCRDCIKKYKKKKSEDRKERKAQRRDDKKRWKQIKEKAEKEDREKYPAKYKILDEREDKGAPT